MTDADDRTAARRAGDTETWDAEALTSLMSTPQGRYWMERLLDVAGAHFKTYNNDGDALGMAWRDGKAEVGRYIEAQLESYCPDLYLRMVRDRRVRYQQQAKRLEREQLRRDGPSSEFGGITDIEALADKQRAEELAAIEAAKKKKPKNDAS